MKKVRNIWWHTVLTDTLKTETSNFVLNPGYGNLRRSLSNQGPCRTEQPKVARKLVIRMLWSILSKALADALTLTGHASKDNYIPEKEGPASHQAAG